MKRTIALLLLAPAAILAGCPHEAKLPPGAAAGPTVAAGAAPTAAIVVPDVTGQTAATATPLDASSFGALMDGWRVVVRGTEVRVASDPLDGHITGFDRLPVRLGGAFLFRARAALYVAATFDGPLRPLRGFAENVGSVSFGPRGALVRTADGQRFMIDVASGASLPVDPPGAADLAALPDGRAAALAEGARLFLSTDHGAHWSEATQALGGAP